jgi:hypothetical protein
MKIKIGKLMIYIGFHIIDEEKDEGGKIRKEALEWLVEKTSKVKDKQFTGMSLHFRGFPKEKGIISHGSMMIFLK